MVKMVIQCLLFLLCLFFSGAVSIESNKGSHSKSPTANLQLSKHQAEHQSVKQSVHEPTRAFHRMLSIGDELHSTQMDVVTPVTTVPIINPTPITTYPIYNPVSPVTPVTNPSTPTMTPVTNPDTNPTTGTPTYGGGGDTPTYGGTPTMTPTMTPSYAFNNYYQKNPQPTSCDFGGTAVITNTDPSTSTCQYPSTSTSSSVLNTTNPTGSGSTVFGSEPPSYSSSTSMSIRMHLLFTLACFLISFFYHNAYD